MNATRTSPRTCVGPGSPGNFSLSHSVEDVSAAIAYLRETSVCSTLRLDPKRIVLIGHSMGGFLAIQAASIDVSIAGVGLISPVDFGGMIPHPLAKDQETMVLKGVAGGLAHQGLAPLSGCTPEGLAQDILDHSTEWSFASKAISLRSRPVFLMTADDGWPQSNDEFADDLRKSGAEHLTARHLATDHSYSGQRDALSREILTWLARISRMEK